ncbi:hypothetical protein K503DRAFT_339327 [Rhizopogon vinicolor AM-OR11-026]|uniref:Uncharacterized protein n=1 Tax=Rhizopogon vinicolor AM-OR11-026 TaxID=1314800 RepID=A0A1B7MTH7_9AGAM|nr:hypothetical protein K503DRAFT_339327 [Rhizopogon vinicolor AM-OR11-026]
MRFSFLVVIAALTASMSVSACSWYGGNCTADSDCCDDYYCDISGDRLADSLTCTSRHLLLNRPGSCFGTNPLSLAKRPLDRGLRRLI